VVKNLPSPALPACLALIACILLCIPSSAAPLDEKIQAFSDARNPTPAQASEILKLGLEQNRSLEAFNAVKRWLNNNPVDSPQLLQQAAQAAERAGEGTLAIGFYRKLLDNPAVDANIAAQAVPAAWRLLINHLGDQDSAYQWMAQDGNRLRAFGRAHQFDTWFLAEARRRNDFLAACERLTSMNGDSRVNITDHIDSLEWLAAKLESFRHENDSWYPAALEFAAANRIPETYRARVAWAATVIPYNRALDEARAAERPVEPAFTDAPLAAAARLLNALPVQGALLVASGWGVEYDHGHSGNCHRRFEIEGERKLAQLLSHLPRMSPERRHELLAFPIAQGRVGFDRAAVRTFVTANPDTLNSLAANNVPLIDPQLTEEGTRALAPHLARNPHLEAALIRAHAAGARTASAAMTHIMEKEAWRITEIKPVIDAVLRSHLFEKDVEAAPLEARHPNLGPRHETFKNQTAPGGDANRYQSAFNELHRDLKSNAPQIPGALTLWNELFKNATDEAKIAMIRTLISANDREQLFLLHRALANAPIKTNGRISWQANTDLGNHFRHHRPDRELVTPLLQSLVDLLRRQIQEGTLSETHFGMWLFAADYQDDSQRQLMAEIAKSPAYLKLNRNYQIVAANDQMFGHIALTPRDALSNPHFVSAELLALAENTAPNEIENAFARVVDLASKAPAITAVIGLQPVAKLETWSDRTLTLALSLLSENAPIGDYPTLQGYEPLIVKLTSHLTAAENWGRLEPHTTGLWHAALASDNPGGNPSAIRALRTFAENAIAADRPDIALALTRAATAGAAGQSLATSNHNTYRAESEALRLLVRKAGELAGILTVTVDPSDPAFPIYQSQSEWLAGNVDTAWALFSDHPDRHLPVLRDLSVDYGFWLLQRLLDEDENEAAEALVRELTIWSRQVEGTFTAEQDARLRIAFAELSFRKGNLPTARAWYRQVADTATLRGTPVHLAAALGSVRVDRVSRNFSAAITELDALMRIDDPTFRLAAQSARAEVLMDQENFAEALREIEAVLRAQPKDSDALILQAKIQYQMRKLVEASEIEIGPSVDETVLVPGEPLKINLRDPSLSVSGLGADIEIEVWTTSGDRERVLLAPFGDSRERLRAEILTALGAPTPGDRTLQILGNDEIRFGYSKEFRQRMKDLPADPDTVITVASDARLAISAGGFPPRDGERRLSLEELGISTAQAALGARSVRPGNPIYIRLTDPDQSKTTNPDTIRLTAFTSSGDEIRNLILTESGPFSGEFQAIVPTATATAMATASESAPGRDPNMAISTKYTNGWLGAISDSKEARLFTIDVNDDAAVDQLNIQSGATADSLTHFALQTSMNGIDWTTRARFPAEAAPWDGRPQISSFPTFRSALTITPPTSRELPADWLQKMEVESARPDCLFLSAHVANLSSENLPIVKTGHPSYPGLIRFRATFHQPTAAIRRFQLEGLPFQDDKETIQTLFLLNGTPASEDSENPHTIERELSPGLHTIEIWHHGGRDAFLKTKPRILQDIPGQAELTPVPDDMFDPATFPEAVRAAIAHQASITPSENGQLDVQFHPTTRARLIRLAIFGFEGLAPRIDRITLTDREKSTLLPIDVDFMALRQNDQLEVLPGDTITVRYEDPVSATPKRTLHEQRLQAAYNDGTIAVSFLTYETNAEGERVFVPQPIRRFRFDDALTVLIEDADLDTTPGRDTVEFTVTNSEGTSITLQAVESTENSGSFMGRFFPVEAAPTRDSEIQLTPGASLTITYRDNENLTPGIPTDRTTTINHALYQTPTIAAYGHTTEPVALTAPPAPAKTQASWMPQPLTPRRAIDFTHHADSELPATTPAIILGAPLRFDIVASHLALTHTSEVPAFVQTESARKAAGITDGSFNINVPGTLRLTGSLNPPSITPPPGYSLRRAPTAPTNSPPLEEGRFSFAIPVNLGPAPARSYATREARDLPPSEIPNSLAAKVGETVHVGYPWQDPDGKVHWKSASFQIESHAFLDVMQAGYTESLDRLYIGERAYVRLVAPGLSRSDQNDVTEVTLTAASGATAPLELFETEPYSGVFTAAFDVRIAAPDEPKTLPPVAAHGFPVRYGDTLTLTHADQSHTLAINMGADGEIEPFTKRFTGDEMAVQTSFVLAESYFELAKKHNEMEEESLARRQIGQAHRLLAEAVANHHDQNLKAHAEYLLGNLAMEFAELAKNEEAKTPMYQDALARFILITDDFPESEFAPKAQLKIAQTYELMGETSSSIEEYVKLAYKYPDHELIPTVMARLGKYFQGIGQGYKEQADPLREKTDPESLAEVIRLDALAAVEFLNAANVYAKLERRFPEDPLAGVASLGAAQNFMRAHRYSEAIDQFQRVIDNAEYDGPTLRSQALYWAGLSHERLLATYSEDNWKARGTAQNTAYQLYRRVTFDFPDSNWAKFARGRLADPAFERLVREEAEKRARMIEALKEEQKNRRR
jgi:outer membrane protein assembly factor BamD (BamD/ComL family)